MKNSRKTGRWVIFLVLAVWLTSCSSAASQIAAVPTLTIPPAGTVTAGTAMAVAATVSPTKTPSNTATLPSIAATQTASPLPAAPTATGTPPALTDEEVLAHAAMPASDRAYCSWQILGQDKLKLYAWAFCMDVGKYFGAKGSGPAIIHLDEQGHYREVEWALDGVHHAALVKQFPPDAQQAIASPDQPNGLRINMQALEWGVQARGREFDTPYVLPLAGFDDRYCTEGPARMGSDLPLADEKDYPGWKKYTQSVDGFSFNLPADWSIEEHWFSCVQKPPAPHYLFLQPPGERYRMVISFRKPDEGEWITRSGTPSGDFVDGGTLNFLKKQVNIQRLIYGTRVMAVFYDSSAEFPAGGLLFTLSLDIANDPKDNASIPPEIEAQAAKILQSFQRIP